MVALLSLDHSSLLNLCFPKEIDDYRMIIKLANMMDELVPHDEYIDDMDVMDIHHVVNIVKLESISLFDLFGVFSIVCSEDVQHVLTLELLEDVIVIIIIIIIIIIMMMMMMMMMMMYVRALLTQLLLSLFLWIYLLLLMHYQDLSPILMMYSHFHLWI